jgi:hypothetical protein
MLSEPHRYVEAFARAGADLISVHIEPTYDHVGTLARIRSLGSQAGIVLNPDTPASAVESLLASVDLVLVMTVRPTRRLAKGEGSHLPPRGGRRGGPLDGPQMPRRRRRYLRRRNVLF